MSSRAVTDLTEDQALPALAQALDKDLTLQFLAQVVGLNLDNARALAYSAEVLNHKLGRRCTIIVHADAS